MSKGWRALLLLPLFVAAPAIAEETVGRHEAAFEEPAFEEAVFEEAAFERHCLALNIYFEARSEPLLGKIGVGHVVLNRMRDPRYPQSACAVVRQGGERILYRCQFTWWCDGKSDRPTDRSAWQQSVYIAELIYNHVLPDPTGGALWYHADYVNPKWSKALFERVKLGRHIFYVDPGAKADALRSDNSARCLATERLAVESDDPIEVWSTGAETPDASPEWGPPVSAGEPAKGLALAFTKPSAAAEPLDGS